MENNNDVTKTPVCSCCCTKHTDRSEAERKKLVNRLKRIEGQIRGIIGMLENDQKEQYVEKGSEFDHIFKINKNGYYQLYMENKSKDKVTFAGAYSVHEKDEEE